jgi:hypothetical protein
MKIVRLCVLIAGLCLSHSAWTQTTTGMDSDPHFSLQMSNDQVRVYLVTLRPGDRSMVRHDHNFLVVTLKDSSLFMWPEGTSDIIESRFTKGSIGFYYGGKTIGMRNGQNVTYRNVTVEFLDPRVTNYGYQWTSGSWDYGATGASLPADPNAAFANRLPLGAATAIDVQLLPNSSLPRPDADVSGLIVPVTDIVLQAGNDEIQKSSGDVTWISGRRPKLVNAAGTAARFAVIEFQSPTSK